MQKKLLNYFTILLFSLSFAYSEKWENPDDGNWITVDSLFGDYSSKAKGSADYFQIDFLDSANGIAFGGNSMAASNYFVLKKTSDAGNTWHEIRIDTFANPKQPMYPFRRKIKYANENRIVVACDSGYVLISNDGGSTWEDKKVGIFPEKYYLYQHMDFYNDLGMVKYAGEDNTFITRDSGENWEKMAFSLGINMTYPCMKFNIINDSTIIMNSLNVVNEKSVWYFHISRDQGRTWEQISSFDKDDFYYFRINFINEKFGTCNNYLNISDTSKQQIFYRTFDGGVTWSEFWRSDTVRSVGNYVGTFGHLKFFDGQHGMASNITKGYLITSDGGDSWDIYDPQFSNDIYSVNHYTLSFSYSTADIPFVLKGPRILKYVGSLNTVESKPEESYILYPNPATDFITINSENILKYQTYEICDIMGRAVQSGNIESDKIILNDFPTGIYFLKLIGTTETKSMKFVRE